jgi:hypothetical protein
MIWSQYYAIRCNGCEGRYYVDAGDPNDCTGFDPTAVKCPWCGAVETLGDESDCEDDDDGSASVGKKSLLECPPPVKNVR